MTQKNSPDAVQHHPLLRFNGHRPAGDDGCYDPKRGQYRLKDKSYQVIDVSHALHKRIDTGATQLADLRQYRRHSVQHRQRWPARNAVEAGCLLHGKPRRKTEALIFGSHDSSTLEMTQKMSSYLDILWGAETIPWSMYYLNGLDNSLILVSTRR